MLKRYETQSYRSVKLHANTPKLCFKVVVLEVFCPLHIMSHQCERQELGRNNAIDFVDKRDVFSPLNHVCVCMDKHANV